MCKACIGRWYIFIDHKLFFKLLLCTSYMARFPNSVSQWLELRKFRSMSFKYSFDFFFILQSTLHLPQCSCNPHICVHDMVKQETPSEAESRQLLITAAATGGSIWKCVTSSNHWVQSYKWGGECLFQAALSLEVILSLPKAMAVSKISFCQSEESIFQCVPA